MGHWKDSACKADYLGVTAHVITKDGKYLKLVLCLKPVVSHAAKFLVEDLESILEDYEIKDKVHFIVTDGASVNKSAFKTSDVYDRVLAAIETVDDESDEGIPDDDGQDETGLEKEGAYYKETSLPDVVRTPGQVLGRRWIWCAAHLIQLACADAFGDLDEDHVLFKLLNALQRVCRRIRKTAIARMLKRVLKQDIAVRWDSRLAMVTSFLHTQNDESWMQMLRKVKKDPKKIGLKEDLELLLNAESKRVLKEFVEIMQLVQETRKTLSSDQFPTMGLFVPLKAVLLMKLKAHTERLDRNSALDAFVTGLRNSLNYRMKVEEWHVVSTILNPAFRKDQVMKMLAYVAEQSQNADNLFEEGCSLIRSLITQMSGTPVPSQEEQSEDDPFSAFNGLPASQIEDQLTQYLAAPKIDRRDKTDPQKEKKATDRYLEIADWFKRNKHLYDIITKIAECFMGPATSVSVERLFSIAGIKLGKQNFNLSQKNLEARLLYSCNKHLVSDTDFEITVQMMKEAKEEEKEPETGEEQETGEKEGNKDKDCVQLD